MRRNQNFFVDILFIGSSEGCGSGAFDGKVCLENEELYEVGVLNFPLEGIIVELVSGGGLGRLGEGDVLADVSSRVPMTVYQRYF